MFWLDLELGWTVVSLFHIKEAKLQGRAGSMLLSNLWQRATGYEVQMNTEKVSL